MKGTRKALIIVGIVSIFAWTMWAAPAAAESAARIDTVSKSNFGKTVKQLETAIKGRGMMVVATVDHQNMLRMVGANVKGSKTLEFGKPDMMKMVIPSTPEAGLEMPMKIYVYEQADGKTLVSYVKPSAGFAAYGKADLNMVGQMMDNMLGEIVAEATR
ncbi:MAG: DUF302 domain-containing protein [candidate division NC10 bacterium]|nr:DUF302 domain-containing protein [candidate division NC10 bacterium]